MSPTAKDLLRKEYSKIPLRENKRRAVVISEDKWNEMISYIKTNTYPNSTFKPTAPHERTK